MNAKFRVACALATFLACSAGTAEAKELVIGVLNPLTGMGADLGMCAQQAIEPAVEEINRAGGINGTTLRVIFRDDESDPQKGVAGAQELLTRQRVDIMLGTNLTNVAFAVAPIVNAAHIPMITFATGAAIIDAAKFPYLFRTNMHTDIEAALLVGYVKQQGFKAPATLVDNTAYGQSGLKELLPALERAGLKPVASETLDITSTDMTGTVLRIQKSGADVIMAWANGGPLAQVARANERIGYNVPGFAGAGLHQEAFIDLAGPAGQKWAGTYYRAFTRDQNGGVSPEVLAYMKKMQARWGEKLSKTLYIAALWDDTMHMLVQALGHAKSFSGTDIKDALESTSGFKGMVGSFGFSPTSHDAFEPHSLTIAYGSMIGNNDPFIRVRVPNAP